MIGFSGIGRDITERTRVEERTRYLALHDSLTGLPNRTLFHDRLQRALAEAERYDRRAGLLLLDLDQFKDINDMLGHTAGDQLLVEVARRLDACVRASDTVARLGGDEFALILTEMRRPEDAAAVARKAMQVLAKPFRLDGQEMHATTSLGIAIGPADGEDPSQLLRAADMALYRAKAEGRNAFRFYAAEMSAQVEARKELEGDLRRALERGELTLEFQPQFEFAAGRIVGAEALARWRHPRLGPVPPAEFIPLAESSGLIVPLGAWVLREACRQTRFWRDAGLPHLPMAVNLSLAQCRSWRSRQVHPAGASRERTWSRAPSSWRLPKACSSARATVTSTICTDCTRKGFGFRSTTSEPAIPAWVGCASFRSTRSRSIAPSSLGSGTAPMPRRSCAP